MPRYEHPRVAGADDPPRFALDLGGVRYVLDSDGCFETDNRQAVEALADAHDTTPAAMRVDGNGDGDENADPEEFVCGATLGDGGTCSRAVDGPDERCYQHG